MQSQGFLELPTKKTAQALMTLLKADCLALRVHGPTSGESAQVLVCLQPAALLATEGRTLFFGYWGETVMQTHYEGSGLMMSFFMDRSALSSDRLARPYIRADMIGAVVISCLSH